MTIEIIVVSLMGMSWVQWAIAISGVIHLGLIGSKSLQRQMYGFALALLTQPLWFYEFSQNEQWGMVVLACIYTIGWLRGWWNTYLKWQTYKGINFTIPPKREAEVRAQMEKEGKLTRIHRKEK